MISITFSLLFINCAVHIIDAHTSEDIEIEKGRYITLNKNSYCLFGIERDIFRNVMREIKFNHYHIAHSPLVIDM
jgi:hypothetical protein